MSSISVRLLISGALVAAAAPVWSQPATGAPAANPSAPEMQKGPAVEPANPTDPNALAINFELDARSRYVFRGLALSSGAVLQPTLSLSKRGTLLSVFANLNASRKRGPLRGPRQLNETDFSLSQSFERGKTTIQPGVVFYDYPTGQFERTGEVSLNLSRSLGQITLFSNHSLDVLRYGGAYFGEIGVSHERQLGKHWSGEAALSLAYANKRFNKINIGPDKNALNVLSVGLSLTRQLSGRFYLRPHLNFTRILDKRLRGALDDPTILEGGIAFGTDF